MIGAGAIGSAVWRLPLSPSSLARHIALCALRLDDAEGRRCRAFVSAHSA
jgi:hypothetical protein